MAAILHTMHTGSLCLMLTALMACAGARTLPVAFIVSRPPLLGTTEPGVIACFGFGSKNDPETGRRVEAHFIQQLKRLERYTVIPTLEILNALKDHPYRPGEVPDSIAVTVGRRLSADVVLVGEVSRTYTEQYQEEKKYMLVQVTDRNERRVYEQAYWEAYVVQEAELSGTIRALDVLTWQVLGRDGATHTASIKIPLRSTVAGAPKTPQPVEHVDPRVLNAAASGLARQLAASFDWHALEVTRHIARGGKSGAQGVDAAQSGDWDRARAAWERAVHETPNDPDAWNNLAVAYEQAGRFDEARAAYDRALTLRPNDRIIRLNLESLP